MRPFYFLLANNVVANVVNFVVWFAVTYFVYLETKSVFATSMIAGIFVGMTALCGFWFGAIVDHNRKKKVMLSSSAISLAFYILAFILFVSTPSEAFKEVSNPALWAFVILLMAGVIPGNLRMIAMPVLVGILVPEGERDKANGLVGMAFGISFLIVSVISGLLIGFAGMYWVLIFAMALTVIAILHILTINVPEKEIVHLQDGKGKIDLKGTYVIVAAIPGLIALIGFTTFNNFLGGVFMALMDAYGLSMVSVQVWGILWGVLSIAFIVGGIVISKYGLGKNPLRSLFMANFVIWTISSIFTLQPSIVLLVIGMFIYLSVVPFIEASEQTIIQKVVPIERQGRVFGFAQSIEQSASPVTAFVIGPIAQFVTIPFMTTGAGVALIGDWFGVGPARGIALVFTATGIIGLTVTFLAFRSRAYKVLSQRYLSAQDS